MISTVHGIISAVDIRVNPGNNMRFVQISESSTTVESGTTCLVKGLIVAELSHLEETLRNASVNFSRRSQDCVEAEANGVTILSILGGIGYKVYGQSMALEETNIGGRTISVQKLVWTMGK